MESDKYLKISPTMEARCEVKFNLNCLSSKHSYQCWRGRKYSNYRELFNNRLARCQKAEQNPHRSFNLLGDHIEKTDSTITSERQINSLFSLFVPSVHAKETTSDQEDKRLAAHVSDDDVREYVSKETGKDRLLTLLSRDHRGFLSPEVSFVLGTTTRTGAFSFLFMGFYGAVAARQDFKQDSRPHVFKTKFMAYRKLNDKTILAGAKFGGIWGMRVTAFTFFILSVSQGISVYRNKTGVVEYIAGGAAAGALMRFSMGPLGMIAAGLISSVLGLIGGTAIYAGLKMAHLTQEERHFQAVKTILAQERYFKEYSRHIAEKKALTTVDAT